MTNEYEPITQKVREYATLLHGEDWAGRAHLDEMCDNIDAIHRSLEQENERLRDASERGDDWIKLPLDADGVPIRVGDVVEWRDHSGKWHEQTRVVAITDDGCYLYDSGLFHVNRADIRHIKPDTWESILADALGCEPNEVAEDDDLMALVERCKALAGEGE